MTAIETIKSHGAALALEAELSQRIAKLKEAADDRNWVSCYSLGHWVQELSDELRQLDDANAKKPVSNTTG